MPSRPVEWWTHWNNLTYANPDVYGPLVGGNTIQEAFYNTIQKWIPAYIHEFNRNLGTDVLKVPKTYRRKPENRNLPADLEASILVVCNGTVGRPERHQHQTRTKWHVEASAAVAGSSSWEETQAVTYAYGVALRAAIAQHPDLGGVVESTLWVGERYLEKEHTATRTIGLAVVQFETVTATTLDPFAGPPNPLYAAEGTITDPSLLPPQPLPPVTGAKVTVGQLEETDE